MIEWLKVWAEGIIIAVIIGTIIEMIVPEGNNKKYVKTVIGIYIMFSIISPIITKFTSKQVSFSIDDYETYYKQTDTYEELNENFETSNEIELEELYIQKLKDDISEKLSNRGYRVNNIELEIKTENNEEYGMITKMGIELDVLTEDEKEESSNNDIESVNKVVINKVNVNENTSNDTSDIKKVKEIPNSDELKEFLSNEYGVTIENIIIK